MCVCKVTINLILVSKRITMFESKRYTKKAHYYPDDLNFLCSTGYLEDNESVSTQHVELPFPVHDPFSYDGNDPVPELLSEKIKYSKLETHTKKNFKKCTDKDMLKGQSTDAFVPIYLLKFYKTPDPDIYFNCDYNYYYTGGCMEHVIFKAIDYMIRPNYENELIATDLNMPINEFTLGFKADTPILSLRVIEDATNYFVVLREKNEVTVLLLEDIPSKKAKFCWKTESPNVPFVDAKLNHFSNNILALTDAEFCLKFYDTEENVNVKGFDKNSCRNNIDNFSQIEFLHENVILFVNRNQIKLFDIRSSTCREELNTNLEPCNSICSFKIHNDKTFVATKHDLCKYDVRNLELIEHSSHMLSSPPCMMDIIDSVDDTFVVLSGHKFDQKVIIGNRSLNKLPLGVPSILDTFKESRLRKDMLLRGNLKKFFTYSTTGVKFCHEDYAKALYSMNSIGQIFKQRIYTEPVGIDEPIQKVYDWANKLPKPDNKLYITGIEELSSLRFKALKKSNKELPNVSNDQQNKCSRFLKKFSEKYKKDNFSAMAQELMSIWEIETDLVDTKPPSKTVQSHEKVSNWMDSCLVFDDKELEYGD